MDLRQSGPAGPDSIIQLYINITLYIKDHWTRFNKPKGYFLEKETDTDNMVVLKYI